MVIVSIVRSSRKSNASDRPLARKRLDWAGFLVTDWRLGFRDSWLLIIKC